MRQASSSSPSASSVMRASTSPAQTPSSRSLLDDAKSVGLGHRHSDRLKIEWPQGTKIDDLDVNAISCKFLGRRKAVADWLHRASERQMQAGTDDRGTTYLTDSIAIDIAFD